MEPADPFCCPECGKRFHSENELEVHKSSNHSEARQSECQICNKMCKKKGSLRMRDRNVRSMIAHFHCPKCSKWFPTVSRLNQHLKTHSDAGPIECHICQKKFKIQRNLNDHIKGHLDDQSHKCTVCGKRFKNKLQLEKHKTTHSMRRRFGCRQCPKKYLKKINLNKHVARAHRGSYERSRYKIRPYECGVCNEKFKNKRELKDHIMKHLGDKPQECSVCRKGFALECGLNQHKNHYCGDLFQCDRCGKTLISLWGYNLNRHAKYHCTTSPILGSPCGRRFSSNFEMKQHIADPPARPFQCDGCNEEFETKGKLEDHIKRHLGDKPRVCTNCGRRFTLECDLNQHMKDPGYIGDLKCALCGETAYKMIIHQTKDHIRSHYTVPTYLCSSCGMTSFIDETDLNFHEMICKDDPELPVLDGTLEDADFGLGL